MKTLLVLSALVAVSLAAAAPSASEAKGGACANSPCQNDGRCKDLLFNRYMCFCKLGYYGENCENKVKRRCDYHDPCENNGECVSRIFFRFYCKCRPGYTGKYCQETPCDWSPCQNDGQCVNGQTDSGGYSCECTDAFEGDHCEIPLPPPTHDCEENYPCAPENTQDNGYYFAHHDPTNYVQCDNWGQCWVRDCGPGTEWNQELTTCDWPAM